MPSSPLDLPLVPPELKTILPHLQRADELKKQDPIISYWCAYYAAQLGIGLRARDNPSRDLLFSLLGSLEKMKAEIGPNDAVDIESVSSAYVEQFALKVFANADNEDRNGHATRATAKKFLAAANFLQVLSTFPKTSISDTAEEKIRYAKWKAADIAKAFREGRRPAPGPPGWAEEQELKHLEGGQGDSFNPPTLPTDIPSPSYTADQHHSPPRTHFSGTHLHDSSSGPAAGWTDPSSDIWNTAETHGSHAFHATFPHTGNGSSTRSTKISEDLMKPLDGIGAGVHTIDPFSGSARGQLKKPAWTNEELLGKYTPASSPKKSSLKSGSPDSDKKVHFSPTTLDSPPSPAESRSSPKVYNGPESIYAPKSHVLVGYSPVPPPPPSNTPGSYIYAPSSPRDPPPGVYPSAPLPDPFDLTPEIIAKVQKRCRYAISALDYEDAETARKELVEALALLEG